MKLQWGGTALTGWRCSPDAPHCHSMLLRLWPQEVIYSASTLNQIQVQAVTTTVKNKNSTWAQIVISLHCPLPMISVSFLCHSRHSQSIFLSLSAGVHEASRPKTNSIRLWSFQCLQLRSSLDEHTEGPEVNVTPVSHNHNRQSLERRKFKRTLTWSAQGLRHPWKNTLQGHFFLSKVN